MGRRPAFMFFSFSRNLFGLLVPSPPLAREVRSIAKPGGRYYALRRECGQLGLCDNATELGAAPALSMGFGDGYCIKKDGIEARPIQFCGLFKGRPLLTAQTNQE